MDFESKRTDPTELPEVLEIEAVLEREDTRPIPEGKEDAHYADFRLPVRWLETLGLPADAFTEDVPWREIVARNSGLPDRVVAETLRRVEAGDPEIEEIAREVTRYLGEEDEPRESDEIFVYGSKSLKRMETAVGLYERGIAPRIFVTGGMPIYEKREEAEAQAYKRWAIVERGVPEKAIFTHDAAISVPDNVRGGLNELDRLGLPYGALTQVTAWFAQRRSWATMTKYLPEGASLYRVNAPVTPGGDYDPEGWWKGPNGLKVVFNEFAKMRISEMLNSS